MANHKRARRWFTSAGRDTKPFAPLDLTFPVNVVQGPQSLTGSCLCGFTEWNRCRRLGFKFPVRRKRLLEYILCPLTERGWMCFSGCQVCLAVQCKQIAAFTLFSQHLASTVSLLNVLRYLQPRCSATQAWFCGDAAVRSVKRSLFL